MVQRIKDTLSGKKRGPYKKTQQTPPAPSKATTKAPEEPLHKAETLRTLVKAPFSLVALRTGCKEWELSDAEAKVIAEPLATTLNAYLPRMDPRLVAVTSLCGALAEVVGRRIILYKDWKELKKDKLPTAAAPGDESKKP